MMRERRKKVLVDRIALAIDALLLVHLGDKAPALLGGIGQFAEAVGKFDAAAIELEALGDARIAGARPGQRGLGDRVFVEDRRAAQAQRGLDALHHHAAERSAQLSSGAVRRPACDTAACSASRSVAPSGAMRRQQVDAGMAREGFGNGQRAPARRKGRPRGPEGKARPTPARSAASASSAAQSRIRLS